MNRCFDICMVSFYIKKVIFRKCGSKLMLRFCRLLNSKGNNCSDVSEHRIFNFFFNLAYKLVGNTKTESIFS